MKLSNPIGWCDDTTNAVTGCDKISPGCKNCYAATGTRARVLRAQGIETWGPTGVRHPVAEMAKKLRRLNKLCICDRCHETFPIALIGQSHNCANGYSLDPRPSTLDPRPSTLDPRPSTLRRLRLFADSNSDWLDEKWPIDTLANFLDQIRQAPNVDVLLLTKRPENFHERLSAVKKYIDDPKKNGTNGFIQFCFVSNWLEGKPPAHVWLGTSVENQKYADERIPALLKIPAAIHFLSIEPLLKNIDLACVGEQHDGYQYRGNFYDLACENHCTWAGFESELIPDPEQSDKDAEENGTTYVCPTCHCESGLIEPPDDRKTIDWVIVGGESGPDGKRRDCGVEPIVNIAEQCRNSGVPVYVKQDCAFKSGEKGRIPGDVWALKLFPSPRASASSAPLR